MKIQYTTKFKKQYKKLPIKIQKKFDDRIILFVEDPTNPVLRVHPLQGSYSGYWSMNISGDLRAVYLKRSDELVIFALIGTHSQIYE